jgi:hypothetical protein
VGRNRSSRIRNRDYLILHPAPKTYVIPIYGVSEEIERDAALTVRNSSHGETRPDVLGIEV